MLNVLIKLIEHYQDSNLREGEKRERVKRERGQVSNEKGEEREHQSTVFKNKREVITAHPSNITVKHITKVRRQCK